MKPSLAERIKQIFISRKKKDILDGLFFRYYLNLIMLSPLSIITTLVDNLFISRSFGELSASYMSAVALLTPVNMVFFQLSETLTTGLSTSISREIGRGDRMKANRILRGGLAAGMFAAALFTAAVLLFTGEIINLLGEKDAATPLYTGAASYLRGFALGVPGFMLMRLLMPLLPLDSDMKRVGKATAILTVSDIIFDALNIFVFKGGMFGMALSSSLSIYLALLYILPHFFNDHFALKISGGSFEMSDLKEIYRLGAPIAMTNTLFVLQSFTLNRMLISVGGETGLLANSVVSTLNEIFCSTNRALGNVVHMMTGVAVGEESPADIRRIRRCALSYGSCGNVISGILLAALAVPLTRIFVRDANSVSEVAACVRLFAMALMLMSVNCYLQNHYIASGQREKALLFTLLYCGILPILGFIIFAKVTHSTAGIYVSHSVTQLTMWLLMFIYIKISNKKSSDPENSKILMPEGFGPDPGDELDFFIKEKHQTQIASDLALDFVLDRSGEDRTSTIIALAVEEISNNVFEHGTAKSGDMLINMRLVRSRDGVFTLSIKDNCNFFDPVAKMRQLDSSDRTRGIGIRLISGLARSFEYIRTLDANHLIIKV